MPIIKNTNGNEKWSAEKDILEIFILMNCRPTRRYNITSFINNFFYGFSKLLNVDQWLFSVNNDRVSDTHTEKKKLSNLLEQCGIADKCTCPAVMHTQALNRYILGFFKNNKNKLIGNP